MGAPATALATGPSIDVLTGGARRLVSRFCYGITPGLTSQVRRAGSAREWWEAQLTPSRIADPMRATIDQWYPDLLHSPETLWRRDQNGAKPGWEVMSDLARKTLMLRVSSNRQVLETMTDFWSNLLHIPTGDDTAWVHRVAYDAMIRRQALGRFEDLLRLATTHGSMGCFLDNAVSTKDSPNENLGRELLELHSVGLGANYTERDVRHSARMLTGYRVDVWNTFRSYYNPSDHFTGRIRVLDFSHGNASADGRAATTAYLRYLAHHRSTARRIARRLCVRFVTDDPPTELVTHVANAYNRSGTDIKTTLRALVDHPMFASAAATKVRTPVEDWVATVRALAVTPQRPSVDASFANAAVWQVDSMGQTPYGWRAPDGAPEDNASWIGVGRVLTSFDAHLALTGGWWPNRHVSYRSYQYWLPPLPARFSAVVDHMSRKLLARPCSATLADALARKVGIGLRATVTADELPEWRVLPLVQTILDSPEHMVR